ncbi:MAG: lipoyl(octanoyl) transferase LipB [Pseudomonadales bacterium]|nr:lipoyl(octanoyl) transferase LipB [Pseudomonadales bacterium]MDP6472649.1 lipoyl(octanoyl) transferase LipB [Pseudomonadales bacterium]MDP6829073.1 lipoyl(octanoyl) transferase LipB [Pseudomonadales bacterium]MDP6971383.1 lipoyl(octanoyl) transferase LipB [Pseudomonadales bacterium]
MKVSDLGHTHYKQVFEDMRRYTDARVDDSEDLLWLTEHHPVFTQGQAGKAEHVLAPGDIPVVQTDRGGQVTYHGPGQIVCYLLFDLRRLGLSVRDLVSGIERSMIAVLARHEVHGEMRDGAPGVYVDGVKIGALGLRVRRGCSYHGLSLNVDMDLEPFSRINPCGFDNLEVTQLSTLAPAAGIEVVREQLLEELASIYGINLSISDSPAASEA